MPGAKSSRAMGTENHGAHAGATASSTGPATSSSAATLATAALTPGTRIATAATVSADQ